MAASDLLTLRFKYKKTTVVLLVNSTESVASIKDELCLALNSTNVLSSDADGSNEEDAIDIPKPSFDTGDSPDTKESHEVVDHPQVIASNIRLALIESDDPTEFNEIEDDKKILKDLEIKDKTAIAFSIAGGEFEIDVPVDTYDE
jgi:hypothetical protein